MNMRVLRPRTLRLENLTSCSARSGAGWRRLAVGLAAGGALLGATACSPDARPREVDGPEPSEPLGEAAQPQTAGEAMQSTCTTDSVRGLTLQIIEQGNCSEPGAFVELPALPNVTLGANVFAFMEQPAVDAFVAAAGSTGMTITINSMLRAVSQQYLLYNWYQQGRCGIGLAATPGGSNHESGLAFDTNQYDSWRNVLEAQGFDWFGPNDVFHFDYRGPGAVDYRGTDVKAFQILWNRNHPDDLIDEDGSWGPQTSSRMSMAPADGFPLGADCGGPGPGVGVQIEPALSIADVTDIFSDGASAAVADVFENESHELSIRIASVGDQVASGVVMTVEIDDPWLAASSYLIETDYQHPGEFTENDANQAPDNPSHAAALPRRFDLAMYGISPGETKRITFALDVGASSVQQTKQPGVRAWVKHIDDHYEQGEFGGEIGGDGTQGFHGGRLELSAPIDVYSRTRWEFETDRREGWTSPDLADVSLAEGALVASDSVVRSPALDTGGLAIATLRLRAKREAGTGDAWVHVLTDAAGNLDDGTAVGLDLPSDGQFHEVTVDTSHAAGVPAAVAIEAFDGGGGSIAIDWVRIDVEGSPEPTGSGAGGGSGEDDDGEAEAETAEDDDGSGGAMGSGDAAEDSGDGCSCRAAGAPSSVPPHITMLLAAAASVGALRRLRRSRRL